jgi:hypothetical protein
LLIFRLTLRPLRINWLIVGIVHLIPNLSPKARPKSKHAGGEGPRTLVMRHATVNRRKSLLLTMNFPAKKTGRPKSGLPKKEVTERSVFPVFFLLH